MVVFGKLALALKPNLPSGRVTILFGHLGLSLLLQGFGLLDFS